MKCLASLVLSVGVLLTGCKFIKQGISPEGTSALQNYGMQMRGFRQCSESTNNRLASQYIRSLAAFIAAKNPEVFQNELAISNFCFEVGSSSHADVPSRHVYLGKNHIRAATTDAELAAVLSHELSHVVLGHHWDNSLSGDFNPQIVGVQKNIWQLRDNPVHGPFNLVSAIAQEFTPIVSNGKFAAIGAEMTQYTNQLYNLAWNAGVNHYLQGLPTSMHWYLWNQRMVDFAFGFLQQPTGQVVGPMSGTNGSAPNTNASDPATLKSKFAQAITSLEQQLQANSQNGLIARRTEYSDAVFKFLDYNVQLRTLEDKLVALETNVVGTLEAKQGYEREADRNGFILYTKAGFNPKHIVEWMVKGASSRGEVIDASCTGNVEPARGNGPQYPTTCWRVWYLTTKLPRDYPNLVPGSVSFIDNTGNGSVLTQVKNSIPAPNIPKMTPLGGPQPLNLNHNASGRPANTDVH